MGASTETMGWCVFSIVTGWGMAQAWFFAEDFSAKFKKARVSR